MCVEVIVILAKQ